MMDPTISATAQRPPTMTPAADRPMRALQPSAKRTQRRKASARMSPNARRVLIAVVFLCVVALWQAGVALFKVSPLIFPGPASVVNALFDGLVSGEILRHLLVTLGEILAGFVIGAALGFVLGAAIGLSDLLETLLYPYVVAFQTMPKVAIAPLFVVWFGFGATSKIVITATIVFFPLVANTIVGLRSAPKDQIDLMTACTANQWQVFRMIRLPHALPYVFAGLDIGIVLAVIGAIVGEFVGAEAGLGYLILQRNFSMDTAGVFAILIVLSLIGLGLHAAVSRLSKRVIFWADSSADLSRSS